MRSLRDILLEKLDINDIPLKEIPDFCDDPEYFNVGNILVSVFSYSMTLVTFYKIEKKIGKKTFLLQPIKEKIVSGDGMQGKCVPDEHCIAYGEPIKVMASRRDGKLREGKSSGYHSMYLWNDKPVWFTNLD